MDEGQKKAKAYWRYKNLLRLLDIIVLLLFLASIQFTGISGQVKNLSLSLSNNFYIALWTYLIFLNLIYYILTFPLNFYEGFVLEHKFSLSNMTLAAWLKDEVKKATLSFFIFSFFIEILYAISRNYTAHWWIITSLFWIIFSIIFAKIFPVLIIPLFYKYNSLRSNTLRDKILGLARKLDIKVLDVFEINLSKNTKKSNAAIVGWGNTKRIILADNLVNEFPLKEIEVVVAHEMAHYKLKHVWKLLFVSGISTALFFYILSLIVQDLASILGTGDPFDIAIFPAIWFLFALYAILIMPVQNGISRSLESDSDMLALKTTMLKDSFISLMERLAEKNLSDKDPNRFIEFLFYDHPPIAKRIELAKRFI